MFAEDVPTASVSELPAGEFPLVDIREDDEWQAGHAPSAMHIPMWQLPARMAELTDFPDDQPIYVICRTGGRSEQVTAFLNVNGYEAFNVAGGMKSWETEGRPVVSELPGAEPMVL